MPGSRNSHQIVIYFELSALYLFGGEAYDIDGIAGEIIYVTAVCTVQLLIFRNDE